jgi:hypothetical protein
MTAPAPTGGGDRGGVVRPCRPRATSSAGGEFLIVGAVQAENIIIDSASGHSPCLFPPVGRTTVETPERSLTAALFVFEGATVWSSPAHTVTTAAGPAPPTSPVRWLADALPVPRQPGPGGDCPGHASSGSYWLAVVAQRGALRPGGDRQQQRDDGDDRFFHGASDRSPQQ